MMKRTLAVVVALLLTLAMCFNTTTVSAKSLKSLNKDIKEKQSELKKGKKEAKELLDSIVQLEQQIDDLEIEIGNSEVELAQLEENLAKAEKQVEKQNESLSLRLRTMYKNGSVGFMDVLMNSGSFSDFLTNVDMVQRIYQSDEDVLKKLRKAYKLIDKKKKEVEELKQDLEDAQYTAKAEQENITSQKAALEKKNKETAAEIDDLKDEMAALEAELAAKAERGEVSSSKTSKYKGGAFLWPTPGYTTITSGYGWRICPFHGREFHAAIDIGAPQGASIIACASGTVILSGWYGGFGKSVIIDHGGGMTTQYNHCSETLVSVGEKVSAGQTIARVGSTGYSTGPHLDFRVYKNGKDTDPNSYF